MRLGDLTQSRDNNFNLIRFLSATAVIFFHSYALTNRLTDEPMWKLAPELNFGLLGVKAFFLVSGFLVTRSWIEHGRLVTFAVARSLRIYPALICATILGIALAAWSSALPIAGFLAHPQTLDYAWRSATAFEVSYWLPGAFVTNPYPNGVNGSLWTLPVELRLYLALGVAGLAGVLGRRVLWAIVIVLLIALVAAKPEWFPLAKYGSAVIRDLALLFALGSLAYVWRDRIALSATAALAAIVLVAWDPGGLARGPLFEPLLAYVLLVAAYHPQLAWPSFNRIGDYSYGLYIYSFPIQQTLAWRIAGIEPIALFATSFPLTLALAAISWHMVEKPALGLKSRFE
jgi:peptidoglycan/LPS O-acetylase OafA/YrhL